MAESNPGGPRVLDDFSGYSIAVPSELALIQESIRRTRCVLDLLRVTPNAVLDLTRQSRSHATEPRNFSQSTLGEESLVDLSDAVFLCNP